ncbi:MAG: hypothetical protein H6505_03135 [Calditrichaeota bacterium]|nr:hypothetical protein [Calditrichota bacterium]
MHLLLFTLLCAVCNSAFANCEMIITSHGISAATQNWISPDGRVCNVILTLNFSFEVTDTVCVLDPYDVCYAKSECLISLDDVMIMRRIDIPNDPWQVIPNIAVSEYPSDETPCFVGSGTTTREPENSLLRCYDEQNEPLCDASPIRTITATAEGNVGMALGCGTWEIRYFLTDQGSWDMMYDNIDSQGWLRQSRSILYGSPCNYGWGVPFETPVDIEAEADASSMSDAYATITVSDCEASPPESSISLKFHKYLSSSLQEDSSWLPEPGDSVGLVFSYSSSVADSITVRYNIGRISMWAGECMNSPYAAPPPRQTDFAGDIPSNDFSMMNGDYFPHFDCWIGQPSRYTLYVKDVLGQLTRSGQEVRPTTPIKNVTGYSIAFLRADKKFYGTSILDTLWIRARDYGMYCEVTPEAFGRNGKKAFISNRVTAFGDTTITVAVPRDDDGLRAYNNGFSHGDYMADAWEFSHCGCTNIKNIVNFHPFQDVDTFSVDRDSIPEGRGRDGDNFANWEEYRGFLVYSDSSVMHSPHEIRRTDPMRKTFIVKIDTSISDFLAVGLPSYWNSWDEPEWYFTDVAFPDSLMRLSRYRFSQEKTVDSNRTGGFKSYPPFAATSNSPLASEQRQNVLMFTAYDSLLDIQNLGPSRPGTIGKTVAPNCNNQSHEIVPECVWYIWVFRERILNYFADSFYVSNSSLREDDLRRLLAFTIAHEAGHAVDMDHIPSGIMIGSLPLESSGRLNVQDSTFTYTSKAEFNIILERHSP